ncbi:MAG: phosphoserine phosphatase SerB [Pseudomonadota bacterium]
MTDTALTLICNPARPALTADVVAAVEAALAPLAAGRPHTTILHEGVAVDCLFEARARGDAARGDAVQGDAARAVRAALGEAPVDVVVQPAAGRRKALLVADMDSTIIEQECIDEMADALGLRDEIAAVTERAMRGELDFDAALTERVAKLRGLPLAALEETFRTRITLTPGAKTLTATMRAHGAFCTLVSGGFTFFTERVAAAAGFDAHQANKLVVDANGALAGTVEAPILGRDAKRAALIAYAADRGLDPSRALAVGDGANDLAMIGAAGIGVAFRAKPKVADAADARIDWADLTALLYLQGFPAAAFG